MTSTLSKIHVTNSTNLSLNDRFTAISNQPKLTNVGSGRRSRSRSVQRAVPMTSPSERFASRANKVLLAQFQRKYKLSAALKLKRRSMRTVGGGAFGNGSNQRIRRGTVKAFRVGANGKPIRANSLARTATMKADRESLKNRGRSLRRSDSSGNLVNRLGPRRPIAGGAAQRVAKRNLDLQRRRNNNNNNNGNGNNFNNARGRTIGINNGGRSRSRSRTRTQSGGHLRNGARTRSNSNNRLNNRSQSRNRYRNDNPNTNNIRNGRSRSRSRGGMAAANQSHINNIKARLGVRPNAIASSGQNNRKRNASLTRRGVQVGRVQKRRNSTNAKAPVSDNRGRGRTRSRSATRNVRNTTARSRSRSRTRRGQVVQQRQQGPQMQRNGQAPRGRGLQRSGNANTNGQRRLKNNNNGKIQAQQRRGRRGGLSGAGSRNQANKTNAAPKPVVNKDELDKELDQYMATTKTENEMDYLLKN